MYVSRDIDIGIYRHLNTNGKYNYLNKLNIMVPLSSGETFFKITELFLLFKNLIAIKRLI